MQGNRDAIIVRSGGTRPALRHTSRAKPPRAFTLIELITVLSIIVLLLGLLLPNIVRARRAARLIVCSSNIRQLCLALTNYAAAHRGRYPQNQSALSGVGEYWHDEVRIGRFAPGTVVNGFGAMGGAAYTCPDDPGAVRSYAMNFWASAAVDPSILAIPPYRGSLFGPASRGPSSQLILVTEAWSGYSAYGGWAAPATIGYKGEKPGQRFGGSGGIAPPTSIGRYGLQTCELPFPRHAVDRRTWRSGRINIGYVDGHVAVRSPSDVVDLSTGRSSLQSLWSPADQKVEDE